MERRVEKEAAGWFVVEGDTSGNGHWRDGQCGLGIQC